ncbi:hypothetical protein ADICYQ_1950 [Cyclobacterium qasimii M12-11B]|uniref:Uncharacterized protein n=1 Tax=Cyclobacterium qasimii M12-11B TaxID=641524 RepID=S7VFK0_9BACT|nr:hypothetical protein ADICYQ_1950 [Cyclobacterium qasimii M12-11B]
MREKYEIRYALLSPEKPKSPFSSKGGPRGDSFENVLTCPKISLPIII